MVTPVARRDDTPAMHSVVAILLVVGRVFVGVVVPDPLLPGAALTIRSLAPLRAWRSAPGGPWRPLTGD